MVRPSPKMMGITRKKSSIVEQNNQSINQKYFLRRMNPPTTTTTDHIKEITSSMISKVINEAPFKPASLNFYSPGNSLPLSPTANVNGFSVDTKKPASS